VILHTERLILLPWQQEDLNDFYAYASVDGVGQMAGWKPHENKEESQQILNSFIEHKRTFALEYHGKAIGSLGIEKYDEEKRAAYQQRKAEQNRPLTDEEFGDAFSKLSSKFGGQGSLF
jgi:ribosomal-protein-alanine N-acetyltransferase